MRKYIYIFLSCLLITYVNTHAQTGHINFTSLSTRDGLLSNSVNAIVKDRYGLMWFATDDGLNKFDGTNFTVYRFNPGNTTSLRTNEVSLSPTLPSVNCHSNQPSSSTGDSIISLGVLTVNTALGGKAFK